VSGTSYQTQCLIIGSGVAGLSAAIRLAEEGIDTILITAAPELKETNTVHAQGGIIFKALSETRDSLKHDIIEAGCGINYLPAVDQLANLGPDLVRQILLEKAAVPFDRSGVVAEEYSRTREGGHSEARIVHFGDKTGLAIEESMLAYVEKLAGKKTVRFLTEATAVNLLMTSFHRKDKSKLHEAARCFGAFVFDQKTGEVFPIFAQHTILATGGIGQVYLHNTNSKIARGDGIALGYRAGCRLENLEYIQFHPTTFYHPVGRRFLISETVRGEGAVLLNQQGERFMSKYLPAYKVPELAPRDRVAKAIHHEMLSTGANCVYLDISFKPADWIRERFPFVYGSCLKYGVDITKEPIPVVPGAHYHCGGVWTDLVGKTSIPNLWAVGEVACTGLHGANRLASTSLLEGLVWGTRSGEEVARLVQENPSPVFPEIEPWKNETAVVDPSFLSQDWLTLKNTMWNYVGLIKTEARLKRAEGVLTELGSGIDFFYRKAKLSDALIGLRHATLVSNLVLEACKRNKRSLGCYQREDLEI
jgi:L-aspartate oxidase